MQHVPEPSPPTSKDSPWTPDGLTEEQRRDYWAKVLAADGDAAAWARKRSPRLSFDRARVVIRATHPGGGTTEGSVYAHDLSAGGLSFLHAGYLHVATALSIVLPRRLGGEDRVTGRVAWCQHVGGTWHALGVRFDESISPKAFVSPSEWDRMPTSNPIRPESLAGQVLMIDDQDVDRLLFSHLLRGTKLIVTGVSTVAQAVASLRGLVYDVVCLDLNLGVGQARGEDAIETIRSAGHQGAIVIISGDTASRLDAVRGESNVEQTLAKPYDAEQLLATLAAALNVGGVDPADLIYSDLAQQDGTSELLRTFCEKVGSAMLQFRRQVQLGQSDDVRVTCQMLRGSAGGYGYPTISTAATEAIKALDAGGGVDEAKAELDKLANLCRRLTPGRKARAAA